MGQRSFLKNIFDSSPAEIAVIEMAPGRKQFEIVSVNKTKADYFGKDVKNIIGQKCHQTFEALRTNGRAADEHCEGCPALNASLHPGKTVQRDWEYIHPLRKQIRVTSVTAQMIPCTSKVVEICHDCTIQKRVSQLMLDLASARSYEDILDLVFSSFLKNMYFSRCRFYEYCSGENSFYLKRFQKAVVDENYSYLRTLVDVNFSKVILRSDHSYPDDQVINFGLREPRLYYISDVANYNIPEGRYSKSLTFQECIGGEDLDKSHYPLWLDLPLFSADKLIGKLSVDLEYQPTFNPVLEDHEIELLNILMLNLGQAWENVGLLNFKELLRIDELVLKSDGHNQSDILLKLLQGGLNFIGVENGAICLPAENDKLDICRLHNSGELVIKRIPRKESYYAEIIRRAEVIPERMLTLNTLDSNDKNLFTAFRPNSEDDFASCLVCPISEDEKDVVGMWYLESARPQFFTEYVRDRINLIAHQTALALKSVQQVEDLAEKSRAAEESKKQVEQTMREKEGFFRTMQHEMMAPIDPIMQTFSKFKRKLSALDLPDKSLVMLAEDGIRHCQFLSYTFDNIDFVRSQKIELNSERAQIFKQVIIPVIQTVKEYAAMEGVQIQYLGYQNVEKYIELDINLMRNVFFNLLRNSIRYADTGTTIFITGEKSEDDWSTIIIENTGIGIPAGWEKKIFELYQRADNAREVSSEGSGIGLYITKAIIEAHHGRIYVAQNDNPTRIAIELPKLGGMNYEGTVDRRR